MKLKTGLIIGLLVLLVAAAGSALYLSSAQQNTGIIVTTNGTEVTIQSTSWFDVPEAMLDEMKVKALEDVQDPDSTVDSIKTDMQNIATKYNYTVQVKISSQFGEDQLPMPATVKGTSMIPTLQDGQDIIVLKTTDFKVGDIVVAHHPDYNLIVKRIAAINGSQVYLKSDNRQVEISSQIQQVNGVQQVVTIKKTPLDTWLPATNVVGVVKNY
ncbi:MAG: S24/S26 family peptidase [Methanobacterium sp.]|nr:S24/S26 family peptidase [Methanobacterium sp.]